MAQFVYDQAIEFNLSVYSIVMALKSEGKIACAYSWFYTVYTEWKKTNGLPDKRDVIRSKSTYNISKRGVMWKDR